MQEIALSAYLYGDAHGRALEPSAYKSLESREGASVYFLDELTLDHTCESLDFQKNPDHPNRFLGTISSVLPIYILVC
jgi:hypothetical protein